MTTTALTDPTEPMERLAILERCRQGETLYHRNDPAQHWYRIVNGAARKCAVTPDGRRQIVDFLLPGDLFGFGTRDHCHCFSVEVLIPGTLVARYPRQLVEALAEADPGVARRIREMAFESIARLQRQMVLLGRTSALSKVSAFLLQMAERCNTGPANAVSLPMSRYDIADYLAIAVETVSRTLTELRRCGAIALNGARHVRIINRETLEQVDENAGGRVRQRPLIHEQPNV
jgi:CRP/FNR family transcriptional regulator, nitrogen fixation regulation protein